MVYRAGLRCVGLVATLGVWVGCVSPDSDAGADKALARDISLLNPDAQTRLLGWFNQTITVSGEAQKLRGVVGDGEAPDTGTVQFWQNMHGWFYQGSQASQFEISPDNYRWTWRQPEKDLFEITVFGQRSDQGNKVVPLEWIAFRCFDNHYCELDSVASRLFGIGYVATSFDALRL